MNDLRAKLVDIALEWERSYCNAPAVTSAISEFDAAMLVGLSPVDYSLAMQGSTAVQRGVDFKHQGRRYQVKACRPSGKKGSSVTKVPKPNNYDWDILIWILYNPKYEIQEAWQWEMEPFRASLDHLSRLSPSHLRQGKRIA